MTDTVATHPPGRTIVDVGDREFALPQPQVCSFRAGGGPLRISGPAAATFGRPRPGADGCFRGACAGWTVTDEAVVEAWTDRYGLWPLFYLLDGRTLWVSDSLVALVRAAGLREWDHDAVSTFLRLGFLLGDATPMAGVQVLPPGGRLRFDGELTLTSHWPIVAPRLVRSDEAVEGFIELFRAAIARLDDDTPTALPLSGGRDSRHILLELCRQGRPPQKVVTAGSWPILPDGDVAVAGEVAQRLGLPQVMVRTGGSIQRWEQQKNIATHLSADEHTWLGPLYAYLNRNTDCHFDGIGGDVLSGSRFETAEYRAAMQAGRYTELAERLLDRFSTVDRPIRELEAAFGIANGRERALAQLATELSRYRDAVNPFSAFMFWNRTRREIALAPFGLGRGMRHVACPFLDRALFDLLIGVPTEAMPHRSLHTTVIAKAYPEYADLRYATAAERQWQRPLHRRLTDILHRYAYLMRHAAGIAPLIVGNFVRRRHTHYNGRHTGRLVYMAQLSSLTR